MTVISSLLALLTFGLINPVANPAILVIGIGTIAIVIVIVIVSNAGNDVLADCKEVVIMVKRPLDTFGCMTFAGVKCCNKFFMEV